MTASMDEKILDLVELKQRARQWRRDGRTVVYCHGCFDLVHPGHLRYLRFARQHGDLLVVSLTGDDAIEKSDGMRPHIPQELRAESLAAIAFIDAVIIADDPTAEPIIRVLQPDVYVKGKEYECVDHPQFVAEQQLVEQLGGRMIFSSGEVVFSSTELLDDPTCQRLGTADLRQEQLSAYCRRWEINAHSLQQVVRKEIAGKRILVVGDLILDRYAFCHSAETTQEAPMLTVQPRHQQDYIGGAGIVAAHVAGLGGRPHLITVIDEGDASEQMLARLRASGVEVTAIAHRRCLPCKLRYVVNDQKIFRVQEGEPEPLDSASELRLLAQVSDIAGQLDAAIITDFGYGAVTSSLLARLLPLLRRNVQTIGGDVSGARRTLLAFKHVDLLTPNERELRSVAGDFERSLPTVAAELMKQIHLPNLGLTLGEKGCLLMRPRHGDPDQWFESRLRCDYLPSLATRAVDALGGGDAFLAATTLGLAAGLALPAAGYIGSLAALWAVTNVGNQPLTSQALFRLLRTRPELHQQPGEGNSPSTPMPPLAQPVAQPVADPSHQNRPAVPLRLD